MEKSRSKNVNNSRVTHSVDPAVIEENAKKAPDGDALLDCPRLYGQHKKAPW